MDQVELISLAVGGVTILIVTLVVLFRPKLGGEPSGRTDDGPEVGGPD